MKPSEIQHHRLLTSAMDRNENVCVLDLSTLASNIQKGTEGFWLSPGISPVSYPEEDNDICFAVEDRSFWFAHRNQAILSAIRRFPPPGAFFDIGGGNGCVGMALQDSGREVVLLEPGISGVRNACRRGVLNVVRATLRDAGFRLGVLPAAGLFDVVEHIEDDKSFLSDIRSYLMPGGRIYITVPAFQRLWSHEDVAAGHFRRYTLSQLSALLRNSGFEIEYATYFFGFLVLPIWLLRALPFAFGIAPKKGMNERTQSDHQLTNQIARRLIGWLNRRELDRLSSGQRVPLGASCLVVAKRPDGVLKRTHKEND